MQVTFELVLRFLGRGHNLNYYLTIILEYGFNLFVIHKRWWEASAIQPSVGCLAFRQECTKIADPFPFVGDGQFQSVSKITS